MAHRTPAARVLPQVELDRDVFLRTLLRHLAGTLQDVIGLDEADGFISVVGQEMGEQLGEMYRRALAVERLSTEQLGAVLVDLKRRIQGDFYVIEQDDEKLVLGNRACPFGEMVIDRPALCMMTSNVFGSITAREFGYAKIELRATIAAGAPGCHVVIYLRPTSEAEAATGREYYRGLEASEP
jgi:predicted ArsR family transcriptional regulator